MYRIADTAPWTGRTDPAEGPRALRWHQRVLPLPQAGAPGAEVAAAPGVALLGFACDVGVARNPGRPGAFEGPTALRRALANLAWHRSGPAWDAGDVLCEGEALAGATRHAARALGLDDRGRLAAGLHADLALWDADHPAELASRIDGASLATRIVAGRPHHAPTR
jgi:formiminoglutamase